MMNCHVPVALVVGGEATWSEHVGMKFFILARVVTDEMEDHMLYTWMSRRM